jgi:drug/metabolite transporter (DMT)-like permease
VLSVVLSLLSSVSWGTSDFFGGILSRRLPPLTVVLVSQLCGGIVVLLLALGLAQPLPANAWLPLAGGAVGAFGLLFFYSGLAFGTMSVVAPIAACGAVVPVAFSIVIGQVPRPLVMVGLVAALVGVVMASLGTGVEAAGATNRRPRRAIAAALGAALCFGIFLLCLGRASAASPHSAVWLAAAARGGSVPILLVLSLIRRAPLPGRGVRLRDLGGMAAVGLGDVTANTLFALATSAGSLAVASVLGSLYPIITVLLARLVLNERVGRVQGTGAALALLGVVLVSSG